MYFTDFLKVGAGLGCSSLTAIPDTLIELKHVMALKKKKTHAPARSSCSVGRPGSRTEALAHPPDREKKMYVSGLGSGITCFSSGSRIGRR